MSRQVSIITLCIVAVLTAGSVFLISQLRFDYDFEKFFPTDHPETEFYKTFREVFETDNDFIVVSLVNNKGVLDHDFLQKVDSLTSLFQSIDNIVEVLSPTRLEEVIVDPVFGSVFRKPVLRWNEPVDYPTDSASIFSNENYVGTFFSADKKTIALQLKHSSGLSKTLCDKVSYDVENAISQFHFDASHAIGRALGQRVYVDMMVRELIMFVALSAFLTMLFLFIAFRTLWNIIVPMMVVIITILWTLGLMKLMGKDIDIMLTVLPTILFVVGISDSVHILTRYLTQLREGMTKLEALRFALKNTRLATFLTSLTTAVGFGTLIFNSIQPISDFGIYTSIGVMLAFCITYLLLPAVLFLTPPPRVFSTKKTSDFWTTALHNAFRILLGHRKKALVAGGVLTCAVIAGMARLDADNYMLEDLGEDHILKKEFRFAEQHFAGVRPFEMAIILPDTADPFNPELMVELDKLDYYLRNVYGVGNLVSPVKLVKEAWKTLHGGSAEYYKIPSDKKDLRDIRKLFRRREMKEVAGLFIAEDEHLLRFSGKVGDKGRNFFEQKDEMLASFVRDSIQPGLFTYKITGTAVLIDLNNTYLSRNMIWSLLLSVIIIGLLMGLLFRSAMIGFLSVIPNIIPLLMVAGIMGYAGIQIKISTSIIFTIAFGIAVDDTVHYLVKLRLFLNQGYSLAYASKRTIITTGKAMVVTTLILCAGFVTLVFSDFMGTFYIGLLIGLTLILALLYDLFLTPMLILFFYKPRRLAVHNKPQDETKEHTSPH